MLEIAIQFIIAVILPFILLFLSVIFKFTRLLVIAGVFGALFSFIFLAASIFDPDFQSIGLPGMTLYHAFLILMGSVITLWLYDKTIHSGKRNE